MAKSERGTYAHINKKLEAAKRSILIMASDMYTDPKISNKLMHRASEVDRILKEVDAIRRQEADEVRAYLAARQDHPEAAERRLQNFRRLRPMMSEAGKAWVDSMEGE